MACLPLHGGAKRATWRASFLICAFKVNLLTLSALEFSLPLFFFFFLSLSLCVIVASPLPQTAGGGELWAGLCAANSSCHPAEPPASRRKGKIKRRRARGREAEELNDCRAAERRERPHDTSRNSEPHRTEMVVCLNGLRYVVRPGYAPPLRN